jgi:arylsulfatase A-like enzyme
VTRPVGLVDLAPTFCQIAGVAPPAWMEGASLPVDDADADTRRFERVLTEWDSDMFGVDVHVRTITRDGWVCTAYQPGHSHDGTEGEMYDLEDDPLQQVNRWNDASMSSLRSDLLADLWDHQQPMHMPWRRIEAPV